MIYGKKELFSNDINIKREQVINDININIISQQLSILKVFLGSQRQFELLFEKFE